MTDTPDHDPLAELLTPASGGRKPPDWIESSGGLRPPLADTDALRRAVLGRTTRLLRRRRWLRRAALAAALAACYAAGLLTMRLVAPRAPAEVVAAAERKDDVPPPPAPAEPAPLVERRAEQAPAAERAALLRRAGERYLRDDDDPEAALRCYTRSLDAAPEGEAKFSPDDDWLLMAIKNAREKEKRHANDDG